MNWKIAAAICCLIPIILSCGRKLEEKRFGTWDYEHMHQVRKKLKRGGIEYREAYKKLILDADAAMKREFWTVTANATNPPDGDGNDYMSTGLFWWPDPEQPGGLPWVRREGAINPAGSADHGQLVGMSEDVRTLTLAWYFSRERDYADKAADVLRTWFLEPDTRMNPNLEYAQSVPGRSKGRSTGIIETGAFVTLVDAILLLESAGTLKNREEEEIRTWFAAFFDWLSTSSQGMDAAAFPNRHAVSYDMQLLSIAHFLEDETFVAQKLASIPEERINRMIRSDGRQPGELGSNQSFSHSVMNLGHFFDIGETGLKTGADLFHYQNPAGGSLQQALEFLAAYTGRIADWPWEQVSGREEAENELGLLIRRAARYYNQPEYQIVWEQAFARKLSSHWSLLAIPGM